LQKGYAVSFQNMFTVGLPVATSYLPFLTSIFSVYGFVLVGQKKNNNNIINKTTIYKAQ